MKRSLLTGVAFLCVILFISPLFAERGRERRRERRESKSVSRPSKERERKNREPTTTKSRHTIEENAKERVVRREHSSSTPRRRIEKHTRRVQPQRREKKEIKREKVSDNVRTREEKIRKRDNRQESEGINTTPRRQAVDVIPDKTHRSSRSSTHNPEKEKKTKNREETNRGDSHRREKDASSEWRPVIKKLRDYQPQTKSKKEVRGDFPSYGNYFPSYDIPHNRPSREHRTRRDRTRPRRRMVWVAGHYRRVERLVWAPGRWEKVYIPPVCIEICIRGEMVSIELFAGFSYWCLVPGHYETVVSYEWMPSYWRIVR